jgi:hypothetical protein
MSPSRVKRYVFSAITAFPVDGNWKFHKSMTQQVVHIHDLRPPLSVSYFHFVLQMCYHLGFTGKGPYKTATVRCGNFFRRANAHMGLMHIRCGFVNCCNQKLDESVYLSFVIVVVRYFKSVIEKYVSCENQSYSQELYIAISFLLSNS